MTQPVWIENEYLRVAVWPHLGGKVSSLVDKADQFELMFNYPSEVPAGNQYNSAYGSSWYAGWDECFPAVGPGPYKGHPYDQIPIPDHGELWGLATQWEPIHNGITTSWHGLRFAYRLTRKLVLDGPTLQADYTLTNLAPFEFRFAWALHGLLSMVSPVELQPGGDLSFRYSHDAANREFHQQFKWPRVAAGEDLARPDGLPPGRGWKSFSNSAISEPFALNYTKRGRSLRIEYSSSDALPAYWGLWINTGGWSGHRHLAVEPTTGRYDELERAVGDGSAGRIEPLGKLHWTVRWTVGT